MSTKIRLARKGAKKKPFYNIVAADARAPRDGKFIEKLGYYNPTIEGDSKGNEQRLSIDADRIKYWISVGAQPTDRVNRLLASLDIVKYTYNKNQTKKSLPKKKAMEKLEAAKEAAKNKSESKSDS